MAAHASAHPEAVHGLAAAMVASSDAPVLLIDGELKLIAASASFCDAFAVGPVGPLGCRMSELGEGEWDAPQLRSLLQATVAGHADIEAYEMDLERSGLPKLRLVVSARKLDYSGGAVRVILSVSDVTDARLNEKLKDELLEEKDLQLQELQHRVANSLQIIAGVLLESAKRVHSDESRRHLHDAHNRVMSVAALQQQLNGSKLADVGLRAYFTDLCTNIAASMIRDHDRLSLEVRADDGSATADVSMAMGLIVTELVINALKYAFPGRRRGKIVVDYRLRGEDWTLSVKDDGVGMSAAPTPTTSGLGASIVEALARQLGSQIEITRLRPGTMVSIVHQRDVDVAG